MPEAALLHFPRQAGRDRRRSDEVDMKSRAVVLLAVATVGVLAGSPSPLLFAPPAADAQPAGKVYRIGTLNTPEREIAAPYISALEGGLRELGYVEGRGIVFEHRYADLKPERFPELAAELVRLKVDVIVAPVTTAALAAKQATRTIPIVIVLGLDPVSAGLIASFPRPGGNVTGLTSDVTPETYGKLLQLLKEVAPTVSRVAVLWSPATRLNTTAQWKATEDAAKRLGVTLHSAEVRTSGDFNSAFASILRERAGALVVWADAQTVTRRRQILDFATKRRLPTVSNFRELAEAGGLMAYGVDIRDQYRRSATYVDKILRGAKPADLPVEQPTKFELVINLKTAKALGLTIPLSLLLRADETIQ
jgi:putative ABC transport system substrate-binding protein